MDPRNENKLYDIISLVYLLLFNIIPEYNNAYVSPWQFLFPLHM